MLLKDGAKAPGPYASLAAAKDAGAVTIAYGPLINTVVNFLIVAMSLFVVVKGMNAAQRTPPPAPAEAPAPSAEEVLLTQIRDRWRAASSRGVCRDVRRLDTYRRSISSGI